jgi:hypothetical protein
MGGLKLTGSRNQTLDNLVQSFAFHAVDSDLSKRARRYGRGV